MQRADDVAGDLVEVHTTSERSLRWATTAFVVFGLLLRLARYLTNFPLWCDESRLAANLIELGYGDIGKPLGYAQTCPVGFVAIEVSVVRLLGFSTWSLRLPALLSSLASVVVMRHIAGRVLSPLPRLLAVASFCVSWWPIEFAAEVKPYASDLLMALVLLALCVEWFRSGRTAWLWALAASAVVAVLVSFPAVFVVGGACLSLLPSVWRARQAGAWSAYLALAIAPAALFAALLPLYALDPKLQAYMNTYWAAAFPPTGPVRLLGWLILTHTGTLFAYPVGSPWGGSILTTVCFVMGARVLWVRDRRGLFALGLAPLALCFLAAIVHRYPYGYHARTMQFFVPAICLFAGLGLGTWIPRFAAPKTQRFLLNFVLVAYLGMGAASVVYGLVHPYKLLHDQQLRDFAREVWENLDDDAELACTKTDLGVVIDPKHWNGHWTDYYLCYQKIYSQRHREKKPLRLQDVSDQRPLKCVFFNEFPESSPVFQSWMKAMSRTFVHRDSRAYTIHGRDPGGPDFVHTYFVLEFVPRPGAVALSVPSGKTLEGSDRTIRR